MIEIVRDAVTIAALQRIQGGTTGAFKNDALFEWLKGKCPLQEIVNNTEISQFLPSFQYGSIAIPPISTNPFSILDMIQ